MSGRGRLRLILWCSGALAAAVLWWFFPLFRVIPITESGDTIREHSGGDSSVSLDDYVEDLWNNRLPEAFPGAVDVTQLFGVADQDGGEARNRFGRQVGLGGGRFLFVRGTGRIEEVSQNYCTLEIENHSRRVRIRLGVVVGNEVRDSTGLIDVSQFANSQDFNNLSAELNQRVETRVIAPSRDRLRVGVRVGFVGCGRVSADRDFDPLSLAPLHLDIEEPGGEP